MTCARVIAWFTLAILSGLTISAFSFTVTEDKTVALVAFMMSSFICSIVVPVIDCATRNTPIDEFSDI